MIEKPKHIDGVIKAMVNSPFPGLRPFKTEESYLYFGREGQSHEIIDILGKSRFVGLLGSSGTGKSSLVYSGVIPSIRAGIYDFGGKDWVISSFNPGVSPLFNLAKSLAEIYQSEHSVGPFPDYFHLSYFLSLLKSSSKGIDDAYKTISPGKSKNLLIYIDQFEELFRNKLNYSSHQKDDLLRLINLVLETVFTSPNPVYFIISMRSDFLGECEFFPEFTTLINRSHYLIPQMTREQRRLIIEGPIAVMGARISNRLTQSLLNSISDKPDQLPVIQHALMRTWNHWVRYESTGKPIDVVHYDAIGRLDKALSNHANECFDRLSEFEKDVCRKIFKTITERRSETDGIRRPRSVKDVANIINLEEEQVIQVIRNFRSDDAELLLPRADKEISSESIVDIPHESLIRLWDKLNTWVQEEYESAQMFEQINEAAEKYDLGKGGLWRPPELTLALQWKRTEKPTVQWAAQYGGSFEKAINFLDISEKAYKYEVQKVELAQKRRLKRIRNVALLMGFASFISLGFYFYAIGQKSIADRQRDLAQEKAVQAANESRKAQLEQESADREKVKANVAARRALIEKQRAEENLRQAIALRERAEKQTMLAQQKTAEARQAQNTALEQKELAELEKERAEKSEAKARSLRELSVGRSLALRSQRIDDRMLSGLLASHGFRFFQENDGYQYDNDIYNGLLHALNLLNPEEYIASKSYSNEVRSIEFLPDGSGVFAAGTDGKVVFWDNTKPSDKPKEILSVEEAIVENIAINQSGSQIVAVGQFGKALIYNVASGQLKEVALPSPSSLVVEYINNSNDFLLSASDNSLYLYRESNDKLEKILSLNARVFDFAVIQGSNMVVVGTENGDVKVLDFVSRMEIATLFSERSSIIQSVAVNPKENLIALGDQKGQLVVLKLTSGFQREEEFSLKGHEETIVSDLKFNLETNQLISSGTDGRVRIWDMSANDNFPIEIDNQDIWVMSIATTPDGKYLYTGCKDRVLRRYPIQTPLLAEKVVKKLEREMTKDEWERYIGKDIEYQTIIGTYGLSNIK